MQNLNDLAYFAAVVEHGGFAPASRALRIPKSRLSRRVALLEEKLGVRLLQRTTRRFALTDIGQDYLRHCRAMLVEAEAAQALVAQHTGQPRGTVRLACPPALLYHGVDAMLARFLLACPQVNLHVEAGNRNVDLWSERIDLALRVRFPPLTDNSEAVIKTLALSPLALVATPALAAAHAMPATPQDLAQWPTLGLGNAQEEHRWTLIGPHGEVAHVPHQPRLVVNDMMALRAAALAGVGCAPLPLLMVHQALRSGELVELLPGWAPRHGVVQAAFASRRGLLPAVRHLLDFLTTEFDAQIAAGQGYLPLDAALAQRLF